MYPLHLSIFGITIMDEFNVIEKNEHAILMWIYTLSTSESDLSAEIDFTLSLFINENQQTIVTEM